MDYEIVRDHGVFIPRALSDQLFFELRLARVGSVVIGSDEAQLAYELINIQFKKSFTVKNSLMRPCLTTEMERDSCTSM